MGCQQSSKHKPSSDFLRPVRMSIRKALEDGEASLDKKALARKGSTNYSNLFSTQLEGSSNDEQNTELLKSKIRDSYYNPDNWKQLLSQLINNTELIDYAFIKKRTDFEDMSDLKKFFQEAPFNRDVDKLWLIYIWIIENLDYDTESIKKEIDDQIDYNTQVILEYGKCICNGFSSMFKELCESIGLKCVRVSGYTKGFHYTFGTRFTRTDHTWNAVKLNEFWYPCDLTWGSGSLESEFKFSKKFNPYYFLTPPQFIGSTHYGDSFKILEHKYSLKEFEDSPKLKLKFHVFNIKLLSKINSIIDSDENPIVIEFKVPDEVYFNAELTTDDKIKIENCFIIQRDLSTSKLALILILPDINQNYLLNVFANFKNDTNTNCVCEFKVSCKSSDFFLKKIPKYNLKIDKEIQCLSLNSQVFAVETSPFVVEFSAPQKTQIIPKLFKLNSKEKLENCVLIQRNSKNFNYALIILFPDVFVDYRLKLYSKYDHEQGEKFPFVAEFRLLCNIKKLNSPVPSYYLEFNDGIKTLRPYSKLLYIDTNPYCLEFTAPKNIFITASLYTMKDEEVKDACLIQRDFKNFNYAIVLLIPKQKGTYKLKIFSRDFLDLVDLFVTEFRIVCNIKKTNSQYLPKMNIGFDYGLECISHYSNVIYTDESPIELEFTAPENSKFMFNLIDEHEDFIEDSTLVQKINIKNNLFLKIGLPDKGQIFKLNIFGMDSHKTNNFTFIGYFKIVKNETFLNEFYGFPKLYKVNFAYFLFEPVLFYLKYEEVYNFRVYAKDVNKFALVIDSENGFYLDEDEYEDCWSREIAIKGSKKASLYGIQGEDFILIAEYQITK